MESLDEFLPLTSELLGVGFVHSALVAAALLGIVCGFITPLVVMRQMSFTVHGSSELALMGASAALLAGVSVGGGAVVGSVLAAVILVLLGRRGGQDAIVGVVLGFGMGLSVLFIHLYPGRTSTAFALLTGQIVGLSDQSVKLLAVVAVIVVAVILLLWRPLVFASADPVMAAAAGVPVRTLGVVFAILAGMTAAQGVQIVGALLITSLIITPGAAAAHVTSSPVRAIILSVVFAEVAAVGGVILSLAPGVPVSVPVTMLSFLIYLVCRLLGWWRGRTASKDEVAARRWTGGGSAGHGGDADGAGDVVSSCGPGPRRPCPAAPRWS
ncbi:metal ABC transporter permease [Corynebacterium sp.]|uniref:metal ABC transporter permease n=1 Tax=Corynebacterium sp. TaxID=1720 RepID=UPI0026DCB134|nr:metal ABC transporter permease [Corynebacterium sp.]MDO4609764.1 metal ABC transporter permease [Corynebacterium sp.]